MQFQKIVLVALITMIGMGTLSAQCPGCVVNLPPDIQAVGDTIYVDSIEGTPMKGEYFIDTLSFRLPYTMKPLADQDTTGQIPAAAQNAPINRFTIKAITGLPIGLSWIGDRNPMDYTEQAPQTRDGCITVCGKPGQAGEFEVTIVVELNLTVAGLSVTESSSFPLFITVLPDTNATYTMDTMSGCAPLVVNFDNKIASGGNPNFDYYWDFGNGQTSTAENPDSVIYTAPATTDTSYVIYHKVIVDTFPYVLTSVIVNSGSCTDNFIFGNKPDIFFKLLEGSTELFNGDINNSNPLLDKNSDFPDTLDIIETFNLDPTKVYTLEIWDDDPGIAGGDDLCGSISFLGNTVGTHTMTGGGGNVTYTIEHYIDTLETTDSVIVCPECIEPTTLDTLSITSSPNGAIARTVTLGWNEGGPAVAWQMEFGTTGFALGTGSQTDITSGGSTYEAQMLAATTYDVYVRSMCPSGDSSDWIGPLTFRPAGNSVSVEEINEIDRSLLVYPNPTNGGVRVEFNLSANTTNAQLSIVDVLGREVYKEEVNNTSGRYDQTLSLGEYGKGVYLLQLTVGKSITHRKIIVR